MFIIFLVQTVILSRVHAFGAVPSVVLPYLVSIVILENEFRRAITLSIICAAAAGALCGRSFVVTVLFLVYAAIIIFALRKKPLYVSSIVKTVFYTFFVSGIIEILYFVTAYHTLNPDVLLHTVLPTAIINSIFALIIYPLLKITMYREEKREKLLITI